MATYEQGENRLWSVRFRCVEFGKYVNKRLRGFKSKKDAEKAFSDYASSHINGKASDFSDITFQALYDSYLEYASSRLKVSTLYDLKHVAEKHILPLFGSMKVFKISKRDVLIWQERLNKSKYSYNFKRKLRDYLSVILQYAVFYFDLPVNPVTQVESFKRTEKKQEMQIWSEEEFKTFINYVDNFEYKVLFSFLYLTGCRKGEALALTWDKIDFEKGLVTINQNLTRKISNQAYAIVATKTNNSRTILMPNTLINALLKLKENQKDYSKNNFVFGGTTPLAEMTVSRRFSEAIKKADVKKIHLHCLRHSHASYLISKGESIVMVSKRLGHANVQQTLNTYSHLMPNEENKMVIKLELDLDL